MYNYHTNKIKYSEEKVSAKDNNKKKAILTSIFVILTAAVASVATYFVIDLTTNDNENNSLDFSQISDNYFLKEGATNFDEISSETPVTSYVKKSIVQENYLLQSGTRRVDGIDSDFGIESKLVKDRYVLREGKENVAGISAGSVLNEYVSKKYVSDNYLVINSDLQVSGVTSKTILNPLNISSIYFLRTGETNLPDVNAEYTSSEYILKSSVTANYKLKTGETQLEGVFSETEVNPNKYYLIKDITKDKQPGSEIPIKYAYIPILNHRSYYYALKMGVKTNNVANRQISFYYLRLSDLGSSSNDAFVTSSSNKRLKSDAITALTIKPGQSKTYYIWANDIHWIEAGKTSHSLDGWFKIHSDRQFDDATSVRRDNYKKSFVVQIRAALSNEGIATYSFVGAAREGSGIGANPFDSASNVFPHWDPTNIVHWATTLFGKPVLVR